MVASPVVLVAALLAMTSVRVPTSPEVSDLDPTSLYIDLDPSNITFHSIGWALQAAIEAFADGKSVVEVRFPPGGFRVQMTGDLFNLTRCEPPVKKKMCTALECTPLYEVNVLRGGRRGKSHQRLSLDIALLRY